MKIGQRVVLILLGTTFLAAVGEAQQAPPPQGQAAGQSVWAAPAQPGVQSTTPSACGNQPLCYDSQDFAVAVVDFRMSLSGGFKVMDATLRFVNKTNQPLILGYLDGSAVALDDQGNRYNPYGNRNLAGIGIVAGNSGDPKFTLQPGGAGDARWELIWRPGPQDPVGSTFELGMTIREMNTLVGGAHTLGSEVPLRFQGLANGMTGSGVVSGYSGAPGVAGVAGTSPMMASGAAGGLPPCGTGATLTNVAGVANSVGGQQTTAATNTATGAAAAISNLKSIFGKKNAAPAPAANVAGAAPCVPAATSAAMPVSAGTSTAPATAGQAATATPASAATPTAATAAKVAPNAATAARAVTPSANAARTPGATTAAKPAVVTTAAPNAKPVAQPATAAVKKPVPAPAPAKPAAKPAPTAAGQTPPAKSPTNQ